MEQSYAESLLRSGIIEAKAGQKDAARHYLDRAIYLSDNASHDTMAEAWYWMSRVTDDPAQKRQALENALSHDLRHAQARRDLAILDGKLKPDEIVNPDALPPAPTEIVNVDAKRFMCPKCGGRMVFAPDGSSLVCEYCARNEKLGAPGEAKEQDFLIAMATMKGHGKPLAEQVFHCQGCGAEFILPPQLISAVCIYCGSPHVVSLENSRDLIAPDAVLPHEFDQKQTAHYLVDWVEKQKIKPESKVDMPRGLYLPIWTFDLGGEVDYVGEVIEEEEEMFGKRVPRVTRVNDSYPVAVNDLPIPASRKLAQSLNRLISTFDLSAIKPYDPRFLSNWPAEVYDIPMADASLDARGRAFDQIKNDLPNLLGSVRIISCSSAKMSVDSFKLALLPVWITEVPYESKKHLVLINGQNGAVVSDSLEKTGLFDWLADVLKD